MQKKAVNVGSGTGKKGKSGLESTEATKGAGVAKKAANVGAKTGKKGKSGLDGKQLMEVFDASGKNGFAWDPSSKDEFEVEFEDGSSFSNTPKSGKKLNIKS